MSDELDTRDIVEREFEKLEEDQEEPVEPTEETEETTEETPEEPTEEAPEESAAEESDDTTEEQEEAPKEEEESEPQATTDWSGYGFRKDAWDKLNALDPDMQGIIKERQEAFFNGTKALKEDADFGRNLRTVVEPHKEYLETIGTTAEEAFGILIEAERKLRTGNPQEKALAFQQLAHDYGIDLSSLAGQPFDVDAYQMQQQLAAQQRRIDNFERSQQIAEEQRINQTIDDFAKTHEHFDAVQNLMADLLDRGMATTLDEAYEKACRIDDGVYGKIQSSQTAESEHQRLIQQDSAAKAAKASAVQVKGAPSGSKTVQSAKTTEEAVRIAMQQHGY